MPKASLLSHAAKSSDNTMRATAPPTALSPAIREFLDELAELITEDLLEENDRIQDEIAVTFPQEGK